MQNHHLIELLTSLDRKEMTRLLAFSLSPYHNKHVDTQRLIAYLERCYPRFQERNCSREVIWRALFPKNKIDPKKLAVLFTYAWRLTEQFLIQEESQQQPQQQLLLLRALRRREQSTIYERLLTKAQRSADKDPLRNTAHYRFRIDLEHEANSTTERRQTKETVLIEKEHALDKYYILEKLRDAVELLLRRQIVNSDYSARLLEGILQELQNNPDTYTDAPAIQVYYQLYQLYQQHQTPSPASLKAFQFTLSVFNDNEIFFERDEVKRIYIYLQSFCIDQINRSQHVFFREVFGLYQKQMERKFLHENGYLIEWHYKNIATTAIRLGEMEWAKDFIETQKTALEPDIRETAYCLSIANYYDALGQHDKVLSYLLRVEYRDPRYSLGAKVLQLRSYYELQEWEPLHALVESFRQYLNRNSLLAESLRKGYYDLFRLTRRMAQLRAQLGYQQTNRLVNGIDKLKADIEGIKVIPKRDWLEAKLKELHEAVEAS